MNPPRLRLVELLGAVSLATDFGTGQTPGHGLRTTVVALEIGRAMGLGDDALWDVQQTALLRFLGCTSDASDTARLAGGDDIAFLREMAPVAMGSSGEQVRRLTRVIGAGGGAPRRLRLVAGALSQPGAAAASLSAHCEVAAMLAERLGTRPQVREALAHAHERWDGGGFPDGQSGDAIPIPVTIAVVARDADLLWRDGLDSLRRTLQARRGRGYAPAVVDACLEMGPQVLERLDRDDPWERMLAGTPHDQDMDEPHIEEALGAIAAFADLKSVWTRGHSGRVATLAASAAAESGMSGPDIARLRWAGLVHDVGRVGVPAGIWDRPGPLGTGDWDRVRLHPYLTERTLGRIPALSGISRWAASHHERLDGSGYHRQTRELGLPEQLLAAADVVAALGEDRPHRPAPAAAGLPGILAGEVRAGRLDPRAVDAVLAAGHLGSRGGGKGAHWPADLTDREVEVLRLIARGRTNKEVATTLVVSAKTVGRHIENLYTKIGVNSRAAAAVFAMEHHLLG